MKIDFVSYFILCGNRMFGTTYLFFNFYSCMIKLRKNWTIKYNLLMVFWCFLEWRLPSHWAKRLNLKKKSNFLISSRGRLRNSNASEYDGRSINQKPHNVTSAQKCSGAGLRATMVAVCDDYDQLTNKHKRNHQPFSWQIKQPIFF